MDSVRILEISSEILTIFSREGMSRIDSLFALDATMAQIQEQQMRDLIKSEINSKQPNYPGIWWYNTSSTSVKFGGLDV